jgi:hypothetical protein
MVVRHKCDNPICVRPDHLETGTYQDNSDDMVVRGRSARGEKAGRVKLTDTQVLEIRAKRPTTTLMSLAKEYGVARSTINNVVQGRIWKHLPLHPTLDQFPPQV